MEWERWSFKLREVTFSSPSRHKVMVLIYWTRLWRLLLSLAYSSYRPYRCCVLSKNVLQLLFQLLSWSEDNTKALVRFFGSAHQRYDYTWFIVLINCLCFPGYLQNTVKGNFSFETHFSHIQMIWNAVQYPQNVASSTYKIRIQQVIYSGFTETILATRKDTDIFMRKR